MKEETKRKRETELDNKESNGERDGRKRERGGGEESEIKSERQGDSKSGE